MSDLASDVALLLSAGMGKRMRPLTASRPKPLVRVAGKALIDYSLDKLNEAGLARAVVNVHFMADQLQAHLRGRKAPAITISDETDALLETGGGMVRAAPLIAADPDKMDALLLLVSHKQAYNYTGLGDFHLDSTGLISRRKPGRVAPFIFTGIQIVSQRLLRDAPEGAFSTGVLWDRAIDEGRLYGLSHTGEWYEVGTPAMIAPTEAALTGT